MAKEVSAEKRIGDIRRKTRRRFSAEDKIRIVLEGLRGETPSKSGSPFLATQYRSTDTRRRRAFASRSYSARNHAH